MTDTTRQELMAQCSMINWWPRVKGLDVPTPTTLRLEATEQIVGDGSMSLKIPDYDDLTTAVKKVGGPPAFLRSDQTASKHKMESGSKITTLDPDEISIGSLIEAHLGFGAPNPECYYVREWLDLYHEFRSFANSTTPIAAEVRTFIHDGQFHDAAFYWPEEAIWEHSVTEDNWRELLDETRTVALDDKDMWRGYAELVGLEFDTGYWSVDFALSDSGTWYLIDMARGELSWHPDSISKPEEVQQND